MYLIKGINYSLEIHQFPNMLNFNENICLKPRQGLETFEVKVELSFQEIVGFFYNVSMLTHFIVRSLHACPKSWQMYMV